MLFFKMLESVLDFVIKMLDVVLKMVSFGRFLLLKYWILFLKMLDFVLDFVIKNVACCS